ncbi:hypothetical protein [Bradyrhizobium guangdongense]|nr:hypothetical protein [Bradyrhizobium guangdongense]
MNRIKDAKAEQLLMEVSKAALGPEAGATRSAASRVYDHSS